MQENYRIKFKEKTNMKKKILIGMAVMAIAAVSAFNANMSKQNGLSETFLANVEALAVGESGSGEETCYHTITSKEASQVFYCGTCSWVKGTYSLFSGTGTC
jgi:hypothetical protein